MTKLKTKNSWRNGQTTGFAVIGEIQISENGEIEVPQHLVADFIAVYPEFEEEGEDLKEKAESNDFGKSEEQELTPQIEESSLTSLEELKDELIGLDDSPERQEYEAKVQEEIAVEQEAEAQKKQVVEHIEGLKLAELKEYASQYPKEETKQLKSKQDYVNFLVAQLVG